MLEVGKYNTLPVLREIDHGYILDGGEDWGDILLPFNSAPRKCAEGDLLDVFIYFDSEDRIIATTEKPRAVVGQFSLMRVVAEEKVGAFLDWGLKKDLLVPFAEQKEKLKTGRSYVVWLYLDKGTGRIVASTKLDKFINKYPGSYEMGQEVDLLIVRKTELGYKTIINNLHWGLLYHNEVFQTLKVGQRLPGFVQHVREDGKIDLSLTKVGHEKIDDVADAILKELGRRDGFLHFTPKTSAEEIYKLFGVSKKNYKKALGGLYKKRLITVAQDGIRLVD